MARVNLKTAVTPIEAVEVVTEAVAAVSVILPREEGLTNTNPLVSDLRQALANFPDLYKLLRTAFVSSWTEIADNWFNSLTE